MYLQPPSAIVAPVTTANGCFLITPADVRPKKTANVLYGWTPTNVSMAMKLYKYMSISLWYIGGTICNYVMVQTLTVLIVVILYCILLNPNL